jgi:hypothetical protein
MVKTQHTERNNTRCSQLQSVRSRDGTTVACSCDVLVCSVNQITNS